MARARVLGFLAASALALPAAGAAGQTSPVAACASAYDVPCSYTAGGPGYYAGSGAGGFDVKVYHQDGTYTDVTRGVLAAIPSVAGDRVVVIGFQARGCEHDFDCESSGVVVAADVP